MLPSSLVFHTTSSRSAVATVFHPVLLTYLVTSRLQILEQNLRTLPWIRRLRLVSIGHVSAAKFRYGGIRRSKVTAKRKNVLYEAIRRMNVAPIGYQDMARDPMTAEIVRRLAFEPRIWKKSFTRAMVRLSRVDVITGNAGEIRKNCRLVN
uniref:Plant heme peroxidase family profile domain-containing protein n=1 Tax=Cucumis melo TaxID=3656 RepID=A0A9I9D2R5_CUCME